MKKLNQKGFEVLTSIGLVLVIGLVGGVGWYVWSKRDTASNPDTSSVTVNKEEPKEESNTKNYKGTLVSFDYLAAWTLETKKVGYADDFITLKSADYQTKPSLIGGYDTSAGSIVNIVAVTTEATELSSVNAPYIRGSVFQNQVANGSVDSENVSIGKYKGIEYRANYESDRGIIFEFVSQGVFVSASYDTLDETEKATDGYKEFQKLLDSLVVLR